MVAGCLFGMLLDVAECCGVSSYVCVCTQVVAGDMLFEPKKFDIGGVVGFFKANAGQSECTMRPFPPSRFGSPTSHCISAPPPTPLWLGSS
jgi:hypothetical protein